MYMTTEHDLLAVAETAFAHTRPGGGAIFAPDCVRDTFSETTGILSADEDGRSLRGLEWSWDPDPGDDTFITEYVFLIRENGLVVTAHDRHVEGLFTKATWTRVLAAAGYLVELTERPLDDREVDKIFLCRRPDGAY